MIKARPLTGWGLGSYVPVYKAFALYDDGTWVNQAHNDYLEWAAEGGIPFACIMLVLIVWSVRPSLNSIWGVGLLAMCLHATVDYPFARLGTCCWYFALPVCSLRIKLTAPIPNRIGSSVRPPPGKLSPFCYCRAVCSFDPYSSW